MINWGLLIGLGLVCLSALLFSASLFYPKGNDGHYRLERRVSLDTQDLKKLFRQLGWESLVLGLILIMWFSVLIIN